MKKAILPSVICLAVGVFAGMFLGLKLAYRGPADPDIEIASQNERLQYTRALYVVALKHIGKDRLISEWRQEAKHPTMRWQGDPVASEVGP